MENNGGWVGNWAGSPYLTATTSTSTTWPYYVTIPATTTAQPVTIVNPAPSAGHIPAYQPQTFAEDELAWLRRRITEVTDLFPVAA